MSVSAADHAAAGGAHGGDAGLVSEPHGCDRRRSDAANGSFQRQRSGGCADDAVFRYDERSKHTHTNKALIKAGSRINRFSRRKRFSSVCVLQSNKCSPQTLISLLFVTTRVFCFDPFQLLSIAFTYPHRSSYKT